MPSQSPTKPQTGELILFSLKPHLKPKDKVRFFRQLHGYLDQSNFGQYVYERPGFMSDIPHVHLIRAAMIVHSEDQARVTRFLKKWASVKRRTVILTKADRRKLRRNNR